MADDDQPTPILEGPKPAPEAPPAEAAPADPRRSAEREDPIQIEANLDAARKAARDARERACAEELSQVLARHRCQIRPKLEAVLVPVGGEPGTAVMTAAMKFSGFDISSL